MLKYLMVFVPLFVVIAATGDNMLARLGLQSGALLAVGAAALVALLIYDFPTPYLIVTLVVAVAANLPAETAVNMGIERDYALAALLSILLSPRIVAQLD